MTSTRVTVASVVSVLATACGVGANTTVNTCNALPTSAFCTRVPEDYGEEEQPFVSDPDAPVANCSVNTPEAALPSARFAFDGSESLSFNGEELLLHEWWLANSPPGSVAELTSPQRKRTVLLGDVVGEYTVELYVLDQQGRLSEEPCGLVVSVVAGDEP